MAHTREVEGKGHQSSKNCSASQRQCIVAWAVSKFKRQLEELKNEERGIPDLGSEVDEVNDWLDRLADTVLQEKTKTQYVREEVTAGLIEKVALGSHRHRTSSRSRNLSPSLSHRRCSQLRTWRSLGRNKQTELTSNDAALLAALEADVNLAPGVARRGTWRAHRGRRRGVRLGSRLSHSYTAA